MKTITNKEEIATDIDDTFKLEKEGELKELAWIPESLAKKLKRSQDKGEQEKMILDYISQSERDLEYSIESLDDDVIRYKGAMLRARKSFEDAKNEQLNANYALWEKFDKELPSVTDKINTLVGKIDPLVRKTEELNNSFNKINLLNIERYLEILQKVERLMSDHELMKLVDTLRTLQK